MNYDFYGRVIALGNIESGTSARGDWKSQDVVIEHETGQYPRCAVIRLWGDNIAHYQFAVGQYYHVVCQVDARENNGRWFNSIRVVSAELMNSDACINMQNNSIRQMAQYQAYPQQQAGGYAQQPQQQMGGYPQQPMGYPQQPQQMGGYVQPQQPQQMGAAQQYGQPPVPTSQMPPMPTPVPATGFNNNFTPPVGTMSEPTPFPSAPSEAAQQGGDNDFPF